jgi:hypothetical protein
MTGAREAVAGLSGPPDTSERLAGAPAGPTARGGQVKKLLAVLVILLVGGAFVAGYWPQRQRLEQARAEAADLRRQLVEARAQRDAGEARVRLGRLFGQFLALDDAVGAGNFADARTLSSAFFDQVRDESGRTADASVRNALDAVQARRDTVTAGLARQEGSTREALAAIAHDLRRALGYPVLATPEVGSAP